MGALAPKLAEDSDHVQDSFEYTKPTHNQESRFRFVIEQDKMHCGGCRVTTRFCGVTCDRFTLGLGEAIRLKTFLHGPVLYSSNPASEVSLHGSLLD